MIHFNTYLVITVLLSHAALALILRDDFSSILHNDLIRLESSASSHTKALLLSLHHIHANAESSTLLASLLEVSELSIAAPLHIEMAIGVIALIEHVLILAALITACLRGADTARRGKGLMLFPFDRCIANEPIYRRLVGRCRI